jgi:hypothetical protein
MVRSAGAKDEWPTTRASSRRRSDGGGMCAAGDPRAEALLRLPVSYSLALRLRDAGLSQELIAECLGIEPEALGPLLVVAEAKLAAILCQFRQP